MTSAQIIQQEYSGRRNLMTPHVLCTGMLQPLHRGYGIAYELSWGPGITSGTLYGVSIVRATPRGTRRLTQLSNVFHTKRAASTYIRQLKARFRRTSTGRMP